ncbi:MAG TPA: LacI family DNA-binding transcriptional regulator [Gemmatimonadaceae bacterium]|nr:LacI family DNA-binding transcriptional regulator [Gemmatimonadaceae bacterium]
MEQPRFKRVTTHDVAKRAGVSQPTVSLVLSRNANARVSAETRERVLEAARELGYVPNVVARSLVRSRSYAIGIIVPDLRNPFFAEIVSGAERVASEAGYAVLLCETREIPLDRHIQTLLERQVDGMMMDAIGATSLPQAMVAGANLVLIDEPPDRWPGVASDAIGAGRLAAQHLIDLGHTEFGFLGPATNVHAIRMRERGFIQTLASHGIRVESTMLRRVAATAAGGQRGMRALLDLKRRPTAVFCSNDLVAAGALKVCAMNHVRVPEEMSIVGCDDIELATLLMPELTTIAIPARELGARAARLLLQALQEGGTEPRTPARPMKTIASRLVVRGTTAPPGSRKAQ